MDTKRWLILIAVLAIAVRLLYVLIDDPIPQPNMVNLDDVAFNEYGKNIGTGVGFVDKYGKHTTARFPMYPYFLGLIYLIFGYHTVVAFVFQAIIGGLVPLFVFLIAREFFDHRVSLVSAAITALYPSYILYTNRLMSEALFIPLMGLLILFSIRLWKHPSYGNAALTGFFVAAGALTRGVVIPLLILAPIFSYLFSRGAWMKRLKSSLLTAMVIILTLSPWLVRNYIHHHKILFISSSGGPVLWMSYFPIPVGYFFQIERAYAYVDSVGRDNASLEEFYRILVEDNQFGISGMQWYFDRYFPEEDMPENEAEFSDKLVMMVKERLKSNPEIFVLKHIREALRFWHFLDDRAQYVISYGLILPFFLGGLWLLRKRWREFWFLMLFILYIWIMETGFMAAARYRMPFEIVCIVIGAYAIWRFFSEVKPVYVPIILTALLLSVNIYFSINDNAFRGVIRSAAKSVGLPVIEDSADFMPQLEIEAPVSNGND